MQANRTPGPDEARITTPQWALDRAAEIGAAAAAKISTLGVRIVGDISTLGARVVATERNEAADRDPLIAVEAAREAVVGTILSSGITTSAPVESMSSRNLVAVVLARCWRRLNAKAGKAQIQTERLG
jgi:hypothetical protein